MLLRSRRRNNPMNIVSQNTLCVSLMLFVELGDAVQLSFQLLKIKHVSFGIWRPKVCLRVRWACCDLQSVLPVWGLSGGRFLRTIEFPSIIDALALDPGEKSFFAGSRDGKIYIAALNGESTSSSSFGMHIIGALSEHSTAVSCLALNMDGNLLVSGLVDGTICVWDTKTLQIVRMLYLFVHFAFLSILVLSLFQNPQTAVNRQPSRRYGSSLSPPLDKYTNSKDDENDINPIITLPSLCTETPDGLLYYTSHVMSTHIKEFQWTVQYAAYVMNLPPILHSCTVALVLGKPKNCFLNHCGPSFQQQGSSAASEMEMEAHCNFQSARHQSRVQRSSRGGGPSEVVLGVFDGLRRMCPIYSNVMCKGPVLGLLSEVVGKDKGMWGKHAKVRREIRGGGNRESTGGEVPVTTKFLQKVLFWRSLRRLGVGDRLGGDWGVLGF
ncbi:hypothetical protein IFM89_027224 [Coptis chinensis]|uniref:Uncharacterized protein n=1 Tax=Coptis chinensis TaxID=261450 RepID=A0A835GYA8_9MAGN|nr:hypothetical protein IFM89_027224 [Coptis chinensis]